MNMRVSSLGILVVVATSLGVSAAALAEGAFPGDRPLDPEKILYVSTWGGRFGDAQAKAYFEPFERATGIKVIVEGEPDAARIAAMVKSGRVTTDIAEVTQAEMTGLAALNALQPINYENMDKATLEGLRPEFRTTYGIGTNSFATVIAWNTNLVPADKAPHTWADAWNTTAIPGPRGVMPPNVGGNWLEVPLLADGVAADALYPLDIDRAFAAYDAIRPNVAKFAGQKEMLQMLASGEIAVATGISSGQIGSLKAEGAPVNFTFNQALLATDVWVIPNGAPHSRNATLFAEFQAQAENQGSFSSIYDISPVNENAFKFMPPEKAASMPTSPANAAGLILLSADYWAKTGADGQTNADLVNERWNVWAKQ
jgi:putative spermidine/putrescine transport system substrate-binding protein